MDRSKILEYSSMIVTCIGLFLVSINIPLYGWLIQGLSNCMWFKWAALHSHWGVASLQIVLYSISMNGVINI